MAEAIADRHIAAALRPFVRASTPMLAGLRQTDPLGVVRRMLPDEPFVGEPAALRKLAVALDNVRVPGTPAWSAMTVADRTDWWVDRVGRFTALVASIPGLGGALADRLPVQDTLGAAGQGLLLCAIAIEHGVTDRTEQVRLLAAVLFGRDVSAELAAGSASERAAADADAADLTEALQESKRVHGRVTFRAAARALWRFGRALLSVSDELTKRPHGRFYHRILGKFPVVGMVGDYLGERSGLTRAVRAGTRWLATRPQAGTQY